MKRRKITRNTYVRKEVIVAALKKKEKITELDDIKHKLKVLDVAYHCVDSVKCEDVKVLVVVVVID